MLCQIPRVLEGAFDDAEPAGRVGELEATIRLSESGLKLSLDEKEGRRGRIGGRGDGKRCSVGLEEMTLELGYLSELLCAL